jgi:hypothetical protein
MFNAWIIDLLNTYIHNLHHNLKLLFFGYTKTKVVLCKVDNLFNIFTILVLHIFEDF